MSDGWRNWLRVRARTGLARCPLRNQLLIALQDPEAVRVAGFRSWLALGYCVRKGERSRIRVWARCEPSKARLQAWRDAGSDPDERPKPFYKLEAVFSQAQVEPPGWPGPRVPDSDRSSRSPAPSGPTATASSPPSASACPTAAWKASTARSG